MLNLCLMYHGGQHPCRHLLLLSALSSEGDFQLPGMAC